MRRAISTILLIYLIALVLAINMPEGIPIRISAGPIQIDKTTHPLVIDTELFGRRINKTFETKLGLDLQGGSHLLFEANVSGIPEEDRKDALDAARDIMERRVNYFGVSEPQVQTIRSGESYRIAVDLPGLEDVSEAVALIGTTAQLEFHEKISASEEAQLAEARAAREAEQGATASGQIFDEQQQLLDFLATFQPTGLNGSHVKKAAVQFGGGSGANVGPNVQLVFNDEGADLFAEITERNVGKPLGIFLDGLPITNPPVVQQKITGGEAVITGNFTVDEAKQLAIAINSGALPVPVTLIEQRNIGPTLGQESIERSIFAGSVGLISVVAFMIFYYGRLGIIAAAGLLIYAMISLAIFRAIPVVLTLPGIAGFILSVGMAVDANILIFERIKEEQRKGKVFDAAMRLGFGKAMDAIKDANIATLLVAFILFNPLNWEFFPQFGLIRGFALTLSIGVITSLFTGIVITRRLMEAFYRAPKRGPIGLRGPAGKRGFAGERKPVGTS